MDFQLGSVGLVPSRLRDYRREGFLRGIRMWVGRDILLAHRWPSHTLQGQQSRSKTLLNGGIRTKWIGLARCRNVSLSMPYTLSPCATFSDSVASDYTRDRTVPSTFAIRSRVQDSGECISRMEEWEGDTSSVRRLVRICLRAVMFGNVQQPPHILIVHICHDLYATRPQGPSHLWRKSWMMKTTRE